MGDGGQSEASRVRPRDSRKVRLGQHRDVIPQVRRVVEENYKKQTEVRPFLDELPKLMPQKKWYFPRQYLDYFNVLLRALGRREIKAQEYRRDDARTLLPGSEDCLGGVEYEGIYKYVNMYFSTTPKLILKYR